MAHRFSIFVGLAALLLSAGCASVHPSLPIECSTGEARIDRHHARPDEVVVGWGEDDLLHRVVLREIAAGWFVLPGELDPFVPRDGDVLELLPDGRVRLK